MDWKTHCRAVQVTGQGEQTSVLILKMLEQLVSLVYTVNRGAQTRETPVPFSNLALSRVHTNAVWALEGM